MCEYDNRDKLYDISFVGTIHSDRLEKIRMIRDLCLKNHFSYFLRLKTTGFPFFISLTETPLLVTAYFNPSILSNSFGNELKALPLDGTK